MDTWKSDAMHDRPLIIQFRKNRVIADTAAAVTAFNSKLQENLKLIGADSTITFHYFRSLLSNQASQVGADFLDITHGIGHGSAYTKNYQVTVGTMTLFYAGYKHLDDPEIMGAWVKALFQELNGLCRTLVDMLYAQWPPNGAQLLALEAESAALLAKSVDTTQGVGKAAKRMNRWLKMVRMCIASWIVSCAARPRDRFSWIDEESPTKRELLDSEICAHLVPIFRSAEYAQLELIVRRFEDAEIEMGELAHRTGTECRSRSQMTGMERRLIDDANQRKAAECKALGQRVLDIMRKRHEDDQGSKWSDFDTFQSLRRPGDDDLAVIERHYQVDCEDDDELATRQTEWIRRLRVLISEGFDSGLQLGASVVRLARMCDQCIALGATGVCKGHKKPSATVVGTAAASTSTTVVANNPVRVSPPTVAALSRCDVADNSPIAMAVEIVNRSANSTAIDVPAPSLAALADPDVARAVPQTLEELTSVRQALRQWLTVIAPLERLGNAWRSTATLGDRAKMRQWGHQINENYYPLLFCVMEKYESGMGIVAACDAVQTDKGGDEWSAFIGKQPKRIHHPKMRVPSHRHRPIATVHRHRPIATVPSPPSHCHNRLFLRISPQIRNAPHLSPAIMCWSLRHGFRLYVA